MVVQESIAFHKLKKRKSFGQLKDDQISPFLTVWTFFNFIQKETLHSWLSFLTDKFFDDL